MRQFKYFSAVWCKPCKMFSPVMERVNNDFENIEVKKYDADEENDLVIKHSIMSIPTVIEVDNKGNEIKKLVGAYPYDTVVEEFSLGTN